MPRSVFITTATLVVLAALGGVWLGQRQVALDATGMIEVVAERHVARHGGDMADCLGWVDQGSAFLAVRCGNALYAVDDLGRIRVVEEDGI